MDNLTITKEIKARLEFLCATLVVAESCTGGSLSAALTSIPGSSSYFLGGVCCYDNSVKESLLMVPSSYLQEFGAVSKKVSCKMAQGVLQLIPADYSIAITGVAGPSGGSVEKPVGTVHVFLLSRRGREKHFLFNFSGNRTEVIEKTINKVLNNFYDFIKTERKHGE